jgi:hypothetical protein
MCRHTEYTLTSLRSTVAESNRRTSAPFSADTRLGGERQVRRGGTTIHDVLSSREVLVWSGSHANLDPAAPGTIPLSFLGSKGCTGRRVMAF